MDHSKKWLEMGLKDTDMLAADAEVTIDLDLKHKLNIYRAMSFLGITLTGHIAQRVLVTQDDINNAESSLTSFLKSSVLNKNTASHFRESQFKLAQSDLYYRRSC